MTSETKVPEKYASAAQLLYRHVIPPQPNAKYCVLAPVYPHVLLSLGVSRTSLVTEICRLAAAGLRPLTSSSSSSGGSHQAATILAQRCSNSEI